MSRYWQVFVAWFNGRALRERVLVFVAVVAVLAYGSYQILLGPAWQGLEARHSKLTSANQQIQAARQERRALSPEALESRARELRRSRQSVHEELEQRREALAAGAGQFIEPDRLMGFVERLLGLHSGGGLRVRSLRSLPREPVPGTGGESAGPTLYRKGVRAVFEAGYGATRQFLAQLHRLPWAVQVSRLDYQVLEHPTARITLEAHTFLLPSSDGGGGGS